MADNKIILDVEIKDKQALKELGLLKQQADELREAQKKLDTSTKEGKKAYNELGEQIKAVNKAVQERSKTIQNEIQQQNAAKGSLNQMAKRLAELKTQYRNLSEEDRKGEFGKGLLAQTAALNQALKEAEEEYGVYTRNVGNYGQEILTVSQKLEQATHAAMELAAAGDRTSDEYKQLIKDAAAYKQAQDSVNASIDRTSKGMDNIEALVQGMNAIVGATGAIAAGAKILGVESDALEHLQSCMNEFMVLIQGLQAVQQVFNKTTAAYSVVSKLATKAQWLWNAAMAANPVGAIVAVVVAAVAAVTALVMWLVKSSDAADKAAAANERYEQQVKKTTAAIERIDAVEKGRISRHNQMLNEEILLMKQLGATEEEIAEFIIKKEKDIANEQIAASEKRQKEREVEKEKAEKSYKELGELLRKGLPKEDADEQLANYEKMGKTIRDATLAIEEEKEKRAQIYLDIYNKEKEHADKLNKTREDQIRKVEEANKKAYDAASKRLATEKEIADQMAAITEYSYQ